MNILLDTHIALWAIADDPNLSEKARELINSSKNIVWISAVSIWEISIKHSLGREKMPISGKQAFTHFKAAGFRFLNVEPEHALAIEELPGHHQDPFDRILVSQAIVEPMRLITHDSMVAKYSDTIIFV